MPPTPGTLVSTIFVSAILLGCGGSTQLIQTNASTVRLTYGGGYTSTPQSVSFSIDVATKKISGTATSDTTCAGEAELTADQIQTLQNLVKTVTYESIVPQPWCDGPTRILYVDDLKLYLDVSPCGNTDPRSVPVAGYCDVLTLLSSVNPLAGNGSCPSIATASYVFDCTTPKEE